MKNTFLLLLSFTIMLPLFAERGTTLLPCPVEMKQTGPTVIFSKHLEIGYFKELAKEAHFLKLFLENDFSANVVLKRKSKRAAIRLELNSKTLADKAESYVLDISESQIKIASSSATGVFYGVQSLR